MDRSFSLTAPSFNADSTWPVAARAAFPTKTEWSAVVGMLPAALELFAPSTLATQGVGLVSNAVRTKRFRGVLAEAQSSLREARVPVLVQQTLAEPRLRPSTELKRSHRRWLGQIVLELYFSQLFGSDSALLDLWPSRLGVDNEGELVWHPRPLYLRWDPRFLNGLRDFYAGLFLGEPERLERGSRELGLGSARDRLLRHMGDGNQNQRAVRFNSEELQSTLGALAALRRGQRGLHGNFMAFGLYVTSLHAFLESLDLAFDVRSAFCRSYVATGAEDRGRS